MKGRSALFAAALGAALIVVWSVPAEADPPPWAPAHGYRDKGDGYGKGRGKGRGRNKSRDRYESRERYEEARPVVPFDVNLGRCNRERLGQVLGGAAGAALGSTVRGRDRPVAIIGGAILGALIGGHIGRRMDDVDQHCLGQVMEYAETNQTVVWNNPDTNAEYRVTPTRIDQMPDGRYCREYQTEVIIGGRRESAYGRACRQPDGSWQTGN